MLRSASGLTVAAVIGLQTAHAAEAAREDFGSLRDGTPVESVVLTTDSGFSARIIALGAILQSMKVPGGGGAADVVLGFDDAQSYLDHPSYFGATIGRFANRIGGGRFTLENDTFTLDANEGENTLHGGGAGWDKKVWRIADVKAQGEEASVTFRYDSPDGEMGFPGNVQASVTYTLDESGALTIAHQATTDAPTVVNMTNHSYFNLSGHEHLESVEGQVLTIPASAYTPVSASLIPTGEIRQVNGTPFDFRSAKTIGRDIRDGSDPQLLIANGYDHNFIVDAPADGSLRLVAKLSHAASGRTMQMWSDQPALQFYSGNFLDGSFAGKTQVVYRQGDGLCLEPQTYPDAPNKPDFPQARLDPGETYKHVMQLRFTTAVKR